MTDFRRLTVLAMSALLLVSAGCSSNIPIGAVISDRMLERSPRRRPQLLADS